jgi:GT2 family glycosyltransferase
MNRRLRERLPHSIRLVLRRMIVRLVALCLRFVRDLGNIAATNGLDIRRELGIGVERPSLNMSTENSMNLQDFLFLTSFIKHERPISLDKRRIRTSIIICVHNHASYTFQCLRALLPEIDLDATEILVVNNASSDETNRLLSNFANVITVVTNYDNVGFVKGCNQGSSIAVGEYLVFLNNDTVVHQGWLHHLVETVETDVMIGAVGSMLLNPDGSLQEAGGIVWNDGTAGNYGRGADPEDHRFAFTREVDYCSAAALLVRRDLFSKLGGFDERYAPAYYEDTDLCFGLRSLGFKVVYQPLARVTHWEGTTGGTNIKQGIKRFQATNRTKFVEKWQYVLLKDQSEYQSVSMARAADRRRGPRIIVFDKAVPTPDQDSGSQRMFSILQSLARIGRPVFVPVNQAPLVEYQSLLGNHGIEVVPVLDYKQTISADDPEVAILSRASVADQILPKIRRAYKNIKIIFDTVDIHSLRLEREYEITGDLQVAKEAEFRRKQELRVALESDQVWCVTDSDKKILNAMVPDAKIKVIPNIHNLQDRGRAFQEREGLLFIGSFLHRPNRDALEYYVNEIHPLVSEVLPQAKLYLVGSHMTEEIFAFDSQSVKVLGHLRDVDELFHTTRVFVAPLRFGSGMKGKIGQAFSYGLPVVTTQIGAEGFGINHCSEAMVADNPVAFAEAVIRLYKDCQLWQRLSDNGYAYVKQNLSPSVVREKIVAAVEELTQL